MTRILIADDSDVVRRGIKHLLNQHEGWEVCGQAMDGQEAVQKALQLCPDVVVLDFSMPVMNGIEAAQQILKNRPDTKIVLCSMHLSSQLTRLAERSGVTSLLPKSSVSRINRVVEAALRSESFPE